MFLSRTRSSRIDRTFAREYEATDCSVVVLSWTSMLQITPVVQAVPGVVVVALTES